MKGQERAGKAGITALRRDAQQEQEDKQDGNQGQGDSIAGVKHEGTLDTNEAAADQPTVQPPMLEAAQAHLTITCIAFVKTVPSAVGREICSDAPALCTAFSALVELVTQRILTS